MMFATPFFPLRRRWQLLLATLIALAPLSISSAKCPFLPQYVAMQEKLQQQPPLKAAVMLEQYALVNENRDPCELQEIDRQLSQLERAMFDLSSRNMSLNSQLVLRCSDIDGETLRCNGPREDRTGFPETLQIEPLPIPALGRAVIDMKRDGTTFEVLYVTTLENVREGISPTRLTGKSNLVLFPKDLKGKILIGIFKTNGLWAYRKVVWYF